MGGRPGADRHAAASFGGGNVDDRLIEQFEPVDAALVGKADAGAGHALALE
jgi:hypothetical protein